MTESVKTQAVEPAVLKRWEPARYRKGAFWVCLSLANGCFSKAWKHLESNYYDYFLMPPVKVDVALKFLLGLLASIVLVTLALWCVYHLLSRLRFPQRTRLMALAFFGALALSLNLIRTEFGLFSLKNPIALVALAVAGLVIARWHMMLLRPVAMAVMLFSPLVVVQLASSLLHVARAGAYVEPPVAGRMSRVPDRRVIWIVFDEFDQQLSFEKRPATLQLPALDAIREQSLYATNAHQSANDTLLAIPSLLLGQTVTGAHVDGPSMLALTLEDGTRQAFPSRANIFSLLRSRGINAAIGGWYHPYCRLFSDSVSGCTWAAAESNMESIFSSLDPPVIKGAFHTMGLLARSAIARLPGTGMLGVKYSALTHAPVPVRAKRQIREYQTLYDAASQYSVDSGLGFVFLHFPIPHHYGIFNPHTRQLEPDGNYFDNLALVDETLVGLRAALEQAGLWGSTTVLVTSDHSLRYFADGSMEASDTADSFFPPGTRSPRVPFLLKLAGQQAGVRYDPPFGSVLTRDLLLAILSGQVSTAAEAVQWLDSNRHRAPLAPVTRAAFARPRAIVPGDLQEAVRQLTGTIAGTIEARG
jgi:Sulfatase